MISKLKYKRSLVKQYDQADCGPAALLSVLKYYDGNTSLVKIREMTNTSTHGTTMLDLVNAAKQLGFEAFGATGEYDDLQKETMPCIAHVVIDNKLNHFLVIFKIDKNEIIVGDPGKGIYSLNRKEFEEIWKSRAVILLKSTTNLTNEKVITWQRWIAEYLKKDNIWLIQSIFFRDNIYSAWIINLAFYSEASRSIHTGKKHYMDLLHCRFIIYLTRYTFFLRLYTR